MENLKRNFAVKMTAVILSFITFSTMIITMVSIGVMVSLDFYTQKYSYLSENIMQSMAQSEVWHIGNRYINGEDLYSRYSGKNVLFEIKNPDDEILESNYKGQDVLTSVTEKYQYSYYISEKGDLYSDGSVWEEVDGNLYAYDGTQIFLNTDRLIITAYIPKNLQFTDRFSLAYNAVRIGFNMRYGFIVIALISLIINIVLFIFMITSAGYHKTKDGIILSFIDRIPTDLHAAAVAGLAVLGLLIINSVFDIFYIITACVLIFTVFYFVALNFLLSVAVRIKTKTLVKNSVIYYACFFVFKWLKKFGKLTVHIIKNLPTVIKTALITVSVLILEFIFIFYNISEADNMILGWVVRSAVLGILFIISVISFQKVKSGGERIVSGDLDTKIDTKYMYGDIKSFGESLNNINNGLQTAINDKMKSERFKTELITNVSHDIKTPLTSIVNYVDLIKKEECENEKINEYIDVLDRQSSRLKKLIEDLVEASKASTGNLSVELSECDLNVLLNQAIGEYSKRFDENQLELIYNSCSDAVFVLADGRRLWRVFDNLMNNICKYALSGTRVYIDLSTVNNRVVVTFKNISRLPLNIDGSELTERFVRGDRSRNTEGSGLGLSIAKSLTELQNGNFSIETDGDLFKAVISFKTTEG